MTTPQLPQPLRGPTGPRTIMRRIERGEWALLALPLLTKHETGIPLYRRRVMTMMPATLTTLVSHAIVSNLVEASGKLAVTINDVEEWIARFVDEKFTYLSRAIVMRAAAQKRISHHTGDIVTRYWGTLGSRSCFSARRPLYSPFLSPRARFISCWKDAYIIPLLSPMLALFFEQWDIEYGRGTKSSVSKFAHIDTYGTIRGATSVIFLIGVYSAVASLGQVPVFFPPLRYLRMAMLPRAMHDEFREVYHDAWFENVMKLVGNAVWKPRDVVERIIHTTAVAAHEKRTYW